MSDDPDRFDLDDDDRERIREQVDHTPQGFRDLAVIYDTIESQHGVHAANLALAEVVDRILPDEYLETGEITLTVETLAHDPRDVTLEPGDEIVTDGPIIVRHPVDGEGRTISPDDWPTDR